MKKTLLRVNFWIAALFISTLFLANCTEDDPAPVESDPPTGSFTTPVTGAPGATVTFTGTANDAVGLTSISLTNASVGLDKTITIADNETSFPLSYDFTIPAETADGTYPVAIVVTNSGAKTTPFSVDLVVETEEVVESYDAIWVAGGVLWWAWGTGDGYFYEMIKDTENDGWFEILLPSWGGEWGEIKFLGQNAWATADGGDEWGVVDNTATAQEIFKGFGETVDALVLDVGDKYPAYYKVRFNPNTEEVTMEEMIPVDAAPTEMYIMGVGFTDYPLDWDPADAIPMETDADHYYGSYIFRMEGLNFSDDVAIKFIGQTDDWGPIDVGFDETYLTDADADTDGWQIDGPANWKPTKSGDGTADLKFANQAGSYTVIFDYFLQRAYIFKEYE